MVVEGKFEELEELLEYSNEVAEKTNCKILEVIQHRSHCVVYKIKQNDNSYVLKIAPVLEEVQYSDVINEADILKNSNHPNIVKYIDSGTIDTSKGKTEYLKEEYLEGDSIEQMVYDYGKIDVKTSIKYMEQICSALDYLKQKKLIILDLKSDNTIVDDEDNLKIIDFGAAKNEPYDFDSTIIGAPTFLSPDWFYEQKLTCELDIYSAGIILYQMLTAEVPFEKEVIKDFHEYIRTFERAHRKNVNQDFFIVPELIKYRNNKNINSYVMENMPEEVPLELGNLCSLMMDRDPSKRPSPQQALKDLEKIKRFI